MSDLVERQVEAVARSRCRREGYNPDQRVHYEESMSGKLRRDAIHPDYVGRTRADGSVIEQWPTIPYWRWKYETGARLDLEAAAAVMDDQREVDR